jgi:RNA polymerase-binding transcription factor DksA
MLTPEFIAQMHQKLIQRKAELEEELAGLQPHTEVGSGYDENAQEIELDEVNQDLIARIKADLEKINIALERINNGTYGTDSEGKEISEDRLRAIPWADKAI